MNRLDPQEELQELNSEIAVKEYVAARKMREVHELVDEINDMKEDREVVAEYVRTHPPKPECSVDECTAEARGRGLCMKHWKRWSRAGKP